MRFFWQRSLVSVRSPWQSIVRYLTPFLPWLSVVALVILVAIPLGLFGWLLFFTDTFVVQAITVTDARPHTTEAARDIIAGQLTQPLSRNIFFVQTTDLEQEIKNTLPQVHTVHVARKLPGTIKAVLQEKRPALLLLSGGKYYFVDELGLAYEEARLDTLPGTLLPIVKNNDQTAVVTLGISVVAPSFITFIQYLEKELPAVTSGQVAEIRIPSLSAREVHLHLDTNWVIRFDVTRSAESQLTTLRRLLAGTIPPEEQQQIEYIDLRIPSRVYYKTRDTAVRPSPTPKSAE